MEMNEKPKEDVKIGQFWYRQKVIEYIWEYQRKNKISFDNLKRSEYDMDNYELLRASRMFFGSWQKAVGTALSNGSSAKIKNGNKNHTCSDKQNNLRSVSKTMLLEIVGKLAEAGEDMGEAESEATSEPADADEGADEDPGDAEDADTSND